MIEIDELDYKRLIERSTRINKAIEYIVNNNELYYGDELIDEYQKIVDILEGSDSNED